MRGSLYFNLCCSRMPCALKNGIEVLVLDEADRMLDMGFIHDIRKIVGQRRLPSGRR